MNLTDKIKRNLRPAVVPVLIWGAVLVAGCGKDKEVHVGEPSLDYNNPMNVPERPTEYNQKLQSEGGRIDLYIGAQGDDLLFARDYQKNLLIFVDRDQRNLKNEKKSSTDFWTAEEYWKLKGNNVITYLSNPSTRVDEAYTALRKTAFHGLDEELRNAVQDLDP